MPSAPDILAEALLPPVAAPAAAPLRRVVMQVTWSLVAGGSETYALTVASNLDRRRYRAEICAIDQGGALEPEAVRRRVPHTIMHRRQCIDWPLIWRMWRLLRNSGVDVVHTHHFNQLFYSALPAWLAGIRIVHTEHSVELYKRPRMRVALRLLSLLCDRITAVGNEGSRVLAEQVGIPARKLAIVPVGVECDRFDASRQQARQYLGLANDARVVSIIARLYPEKNHRLLLTAFAQVRKRVPQAMLLIAGEGTEHAAIAAQIEQLNLGSGVRMLGVRRDVPQLLAASDVFVLCSDREGLPIAVLEAMAAGRAVVATAVGDLPSVVDHGTTGLLVPPGDYHALADALARLLLDPARSAEMGRRGAQVVRCRFSVRAMIERYQTMYEGVMRDT